MEVKRDTTPTPHDAKAIGLVQDEVARQISMWGNSKEHASNPVYASGQMLHGAASYASAVIQQDSTGQFPDHPPLVWPHDWGGFRDYGSPIATMAVAAAFLVNEIARRLEQGDPSTRRDRTPDDPPFQAAQPNNA